MVNGETSFAICLFMLTAADLIRSDAVSSACVQEWPNRDIKRHSSLRSAGSHPRRASVLSIGSENAYHWREFEVRRGRTQFNR